jgi:methionyl-tRNA formyltransferase
MRIVFAGSSSFGIPSLEYLTGHADAMLVVSQPDRPAGRHGSPQPCPVAEYSRKHSLELFQPEDINAPDSIERFRAFAPDLLITASYGAMIRKELRQLPKLGSINLHPSLLPAYRGATPIQSALLAGETQTGLTIFLLSGRMDAGPILARKGIAVSPDDNFTTLHDKLSRLGAEMLMELLPELQKDTAYPSVQDDSRASYTTKFNSEDLLLDWAQPAEDILNRIRAFAFEPGAHTFFRDKQLKILVAALTSLEADKDPGTIDLSLGKDRLGVHCLDDILELKDVQPAGKRMMNAKDFLNGARVNIWEAFTSVSHNIHQSSQREE